MADAKIKPSHDDVDAYLASIADPRRRGDALVLRDLMRRVTQVEPVLWTGSMVGFGRYHYRYASGREGDYLRTGFASRKSALTLYIMDGFKAHGELLERLGPHKRSVSCLYLKRLDDVDPAVLEALVAASWARMHDLYPD